MTTLNHRTAAEQALHTASRGYSDSIFRDRLDRAGYTVAR